MARVLTAVLAVLALTTAGCRPASRPDASDGAPAIPAGTSVRSITVDGRERTFRVYRPASATKDAPAALVVMLHGGFGSGRQAEASYGWNAVADTGGFLVAYPDGLDRAWAVGGGCCGVPGRTGVDDTAFIVRMVDDLHGAWDIDPRRVYATGMSNGGLLAYRLACDTTVFAAIGPVAATLLGQCDRPAPVSVIHIHGTADRNVRYDGGRGDGVAHIDGPAVPDLVGRWRGIDGCDPARRRVSGGRDVSECPHGRAVELITIDGAGHQWPDDATATIWRFFAAHPRP